MNKNKTQSDSDCAQTGQQQNMDEFFSKILSPLDQSNQPNLNAMWLALRDMDNIKLNLKLSGYALARTLAAHLPKRPSSQPTPIAIYSKPSTQADMESEWFAHWMTELKVPIVFHRKLWEFGYVLQSLWQNGALEPGKRGIGFGCGAEPLPSLLASYGVEILVTDLAHEAQVDRGWTGTNQHTHSLEAVYNGHLVDHATFAKHVSLEYVDMRQIPHHLKGFDFCWSICALEHLGNIKAGLDFVENSLSTLKPGGIAVHTTEFSYLAEGETLDNWATVLFQRRHFLALAEQLTARGHNVAPLDFDVGQMPMDLFIDMPPYSGDWTDYEKQIFPPGAHLKLSIDGFASTCFGLTIQKNPEGEH